MNLSNKIFSVEKEKLFGSNKSDLDILHEFFNRDLVEVIEENLLVSAVAFHLTSGGKTNFEEDCAESLGDLVASITDVLDLDNNLTAIRSYISVFGLFQGLYVDNSKSLSEMNYGGLYEVSLGSLVVYRSISGLETLNIIRDVFISARHKDKFNSPTEISIAIRFLMGYIRDYFKFIACVEFYKSANELIDEMYGINTDNAKDYLRAIEENIDSTEIEENYDNKLFFAFFLTRDSDLHYAFEHLSSNYLSIGRVGVKINE